MYLGSYLSQFFTQLCAIIEYDENVYEALMNIRKSKRCHNRNITFALHSRRPASARSFQLAHRRRVPADEQAITDFCLLNTNERIWSGHAASLRCNAVSCDTFSFFRGRHGQGKSKVRCLQHVRTLGTRRDRFFRSRVRCFLWDHLFVRPEICYAKADCT